jgi:hypothetical protein
VSQQRTVLLLSQAVVIVFTSVAAVYAFQHVQTSIQIGGISGYYYVSYLAAVFISYILYLRTRLYSVSVLGLLALLAFFSVALHVQQIVQLLPFITFSLAVLIGVFSVLAAPSERGKYFVTFLIILILPVILAESQVNWNHFFQDMVKLGEVYPVLSPFAPLFNMFREGFRLLTNDFRINAHELYIVCLVVAAGYMYLRYTTQITITQQTLSKRGASPKDIADISSGSLLVAGIAASAMAVTAFIIAITPPIANAMQPLFNSTPLPIFLFAIGTGTGIVATAYIFAKITVGALPSKVRSKITPITLQAEVNVRSAAGISRERGDPRYMQTPWGAVDLEHWRSDKHEKK